MVGFPRALIEKSCTGSALRHRQAPFVLVLSVVLGSRKYNFLSSKKKPDECDTLSGLAREGSVWIGYRHHGRERGVEFAHEGAPPFVWQLVEASDS